MESEISPGDRANVRIVSSSICIHFVLSKAWYVVILFDRYFINHETKTTSWDDPRQTGISVEDSGDQDRFH